MPVISVKSTGFISTTHIFHFQDGKVATLEIPFLRTRGKMQDNLGKAYSLTATNFETREFEMTRDDRTIGRARILAREELFSEFIFKEARFILIRVSGRNFRLFDGKKNPAGTFKFSGWLNLRVTIDGYSGLEFSFLCFIYFVLHSYYRRYFRIKLFDLFQS